MTDSIKFNVHFRAYRWPKYLSLLWLLSRCLPFFICAEPAVWLRKCASTRVAIPSPPIFDPFAVGAFPVRLWRRECASTPVATPFPPIFYPYAVDAFPILLWRLECASMPVAIPSPQISDLYAIGARHMTVDLEVLWVYIYMLQICLAHECTCMDRGVGNEQFWRTRFPDFSLISPWFPSKMTS